MLNKEILKNFTNSILAHRFDNTKPTPPFHEEMWEMCTNEAYTNVAIAAPRGHAKSTAITHSYVLACLAFRQKFHVVIIANTESQAIQFLHDIKLEIKENIDLQKIFGINPTLIKGNETEIVGQFLDGTQFRVLGKSSGSEIRGTKWRGKRPDLIVCDDLEDQETTYNQERREKFKNWFYSDVLPALSDTGCIRIVGTILHMDSLLERLLKDPEWHTKRYKAHNEDYSEILWPEQFSEEKLKRERRKYVNQGNPERYSQEYLNMPVDDDAAYFKREHFLDIKKYPEIDNAPKTIYMAVDFAISQKQRADSTVIVVVGVAPRGHLVVLDLRKGRWDGKRIIDEMFDAYKAWTPQTILLEDGVIRQSLGPFLYEEMHKRNIYMPLEKMKPTGDKLTRARSIQSRMHTKTVLFHKDTSWYGDLEITMRRFPYDAHDDEVDALSLIGLHLQKLIMAPTLEEQEEEEYEQELRLHYSGSGRSRTTGY